MIIDYKISTVKRNGITTDITIKIYRGDFQDVEYFDFGTKQLETKNAYVRQNLVATRSYSRQGTFTNAQIRTYLNNRLKEYRDANYPNLTFLSEQEVYV